MRRLFARLTITTSPFSDKRAFGASTWHWVLRNIGAVPLVLLAMIVMFFVIQPALLSPSNLANIGRQASVVAILSCGQIFTVLVGGIDLSLGSIIGLTSVITTLCVLDFGLGWGLLAGVLTGCVLGLINGYFISYLRIPAMIATLAMLNFARGAALTTTGGMPVERLPPEFGIIGKESLMGIPIPVIIAGTVFIGCYFFLRHTRMGRALYAIGGNEDSAHLAGIPVRRYTLIAFAISGMLAGLAGVILSSRLSSGQPSLGAGLEFESIAAVVLGGARLGGGRGTIGGTLLGVLFLAVLGNGLNLARVSSFTQMIMIGCVLIVALIVDRFRSRRAIKRA
jgi:ribose transport system permease protein